MAKLGGVTPKSTTSSGNEPTIGGVSPKPTTIGNPKAANIGGVNVTVKK